MRSMSGNTVRGRVAALVTTAMTAAMLTTVAAVALQATSASAFAVTEIVGPAGSESFGQRVLVLSNGNYVIADPSFGTPGSLRMGAVYLYDGATDQLISTTLGKPGDQIGWFGMKEVGSSDFVIVSPLWTNPVGAAHGAGAVTWVNGSSGFNGVVDATNSVVGSHDSDGIGAVFGTDIVIQIDVLADGDYVIRSPRWHQDGHFHQGAVTFARGDGSTVGVVTASNSLVGSDDNDLVGVNPVVELAQGNYVILSPYVHRGTVDFMPASTWVSGTTGLPAGPISATNSIVASKTDDGLGEAVALANGNYVVTLPYWDYLSSGLTADLGAVMWVDGRTGAVGPATIDNAFVGTHASDLLGAGGVTALTGGDYVVTSPYWNSGRGAATWSHADGSTRGITIGTSNSIIGAGAGASVGGGGTTALTNGNYVVASPDWDNGGVTSAGAVTWGKGDGSVHGTVDTTNSIVGDTMDDRVGAATVALAFGNYVVRSPGWNGDSASHVGAATRASGAGPTHFVVSGSNSLIGDTVNDYVSSGSVVALPSGNYVVTSQRWHPSSNGSSATGAATFGNGVTGITGIVSEANSVVGSVPGDFFSDRGVTVLANGNFVVSTSNWANGSNLRAGAVVFGNGQTGVHGTVSSAIGIVGQNSEDRLSDQGVVALDNGGYLIFSSDLFDGPTGQAAAVTYGGLNGAHTVFRAAPGLMGLGGIDLANKSGRHLTTRGGVLVSQGSTNRAALLFVDETQPVLGAVSNITAIAPFHAGGLVVSYPTPTVTDDVPGSSAACTPASGTTFPLGVTTVTCTATNSAHLTATALFTVSVSEAPPAPGSDYVPLAPARLADTRTNGTTVDGLFAGGGALAGGSTLELTVAGRGGVAANAVAATLNVTVTEAGGAGFLTAFPCGSPQPTASNLNYDVGDTIPNAVITKIGDGGKVCLFTLQSTHLVVDVNGAFPPGTTYSPMNPARVIDTRATGVTIDGAQQASGAAGAGSVTTVIIAGRAGVPADASAVTLNVTVTEPAAAGYATVFPCGTTPPTASNVNYTPGLTIPNLAISKIGSLGAVCIFVQSSTHLVVDVLGYFPAQTTYSALVPARVLETRPGLPTIDGLSAGADVRPASTVTHVLVLGRGGVPGAAATAVLNVTVTGPAVAGYVTVYPCGIDPPLASNLNFVTGQTIANAVISQIGTNGEVCLFNSQATHLIVDVTGFFP